jgi:molybdate/tungstate transport system ATP-binding protein
MTLELDGVVKSYGEFSFGPLDLSVGDEVLAVLGPSGSGKSTLLSAVAGIVRPDGGSITLDGRDLVGRPLEQRRVGMVFQEGALFPHLTARENVGYAATSPERVDELASMLEIDPVLDRRPASLSGGERQRVALARTLAAEPDALLLDEPLSSLDTPIRRRLRDELHDLFQSLAIPIVYVTHDQRSATVLGDRLAILREGTVDQIGPPSAVISRPATEFVARFTGTENVFEASVARDGDGTRLRVGGSTLGVRTDHPAGSTVSACVRPSRVQIRPASERPSGSDALTGTIRRQLNEGDEYRVHVAVDGADLELIARVRTTRFERLDVGPGSTVQVDLPPEAVHVLDGSADDSAEP